MKRLIPANQFPKLLTIIAVLLSAVFNSNAQKIKPTASGLIPVNGIKVYYETYGQGKPVILLHGAFMTIDMNWGELIPTLSKTRKIIAIEMQGHGHTQFSERKLSHTTLASDVAGVMDYLKIDSADVVGYSFGGEIAYQFAIQNPKRLKKLVIISSTYKSDGWQPEINNAFKDMSPDIFDGSPMKAAYEAVAPDKTKWKSFVQQMLSNAGETFNMGDSNIAKITAPVLLIAGDNDGLNKIELAKTYKLLGGDLIGDFTGIPRSQLAIIPAQTHVTLMMATSVLAGYLDSFLK
ncbi:alpha/beta hydrolase [Terrimonas sp. NA20]|uniref:Alpha/beta hydrolase n=1 Tax=Terrimonas ginsenosidimutans TaxID=2908004 RepID=A0ABS9L0L4_9BACT|nr:alpha/beta hydrolase [Terrimonas ginsenosidimutans]MCG2618116.1 alpha/beta hydrolase [Terrimonas ginsenosidimutans]